MDEFDQSIVKHEAKEIVENSEPAKKEGHFEELVAVGGAIEAGEGAEKKWPGWPGEHVFRMIVPARKVVGIVGRKGEFVKKAVEETRARIKILDCPHGTSEKTVIISGTEEPDSSLPPAVNGLLKVHKRYMDCFESDFGHTPSGKARKVSTNLLVQAFQAGNLIGKQGATIKDIQEATSCSVRVLGADALPVFALRDDRVVEIVGYSTAVHKAVELIAFQLRKYLVDSSVIPIIERNMRRGNLHGGHHAEQQMLPAHQSRGPPPNAGGAPPPQQLDSYSSTPPMPPAMKKHSHHAISSYGRDDTIVVQAPSSTQYPRSIVVHMTKEMQMPLRYAVEVIGSTGDRIREIRQESGAFIKIEVTEGVSDEMTVEVRGTASQVQTAQRLIQKCVDEAAAPSQPQTGGPPTDQGDNAYPALRTKRRYGEI